MPEYKGGIRYVVPIETGCLGNCTFCVGKIARRKLKSYPLKEIINKISQAYAGRASATPIVNFLISRGICVSPHTNTAIGGLLISVIYFCAIFCQ